MRFYLSLIFCDELLPQIVLLLILYLERIQVSHVARVKEH